MSNEETIPQLRERIDQQNKQIAGLRKQNGELRTVAASAAFESAGYRPEAGALYESVAGDEFVVPTTEAVEAFASQYNLGKVSTAAPSEGSGEPAPVEEEEQDEVPAEPDRSALAALSRSGSSAGGSAGGASTEQMTRAEWIKLSQSDRAAADQALRQGKVQLSGNDPVPRGTNPYDSSE